jgi:competence protein ComEA
MHRQAHDEVAAAARRRLALLGRELEQAGLRRVDDEEQADTESGDVGLPGPEVVRPVGRHARTPVQGPARTATAWLRDQLPDTLRGRTELGSGPALLVVGLVALALVGTVVVVLRMHGDSEAVPALSPALATNVPAPPGSTASRPTSAGDSSPATSASPGISPGSSTATGSVTVDVSGRVRHPGVATLPVGSRVVDAVRKAGGARRRVDLNGLNLARVLVDGEQILVGRDAPGGGIAAGVSSSAPDPTGGLVNLNSATAEQLDTLPGVGPVTAQKILEWRSANGAFSSVDELLEVDGIGEKTLADLAPHVTL